VHRISRANTVALHLPDGAEQRRRDDVLAAHAGLAGQDWIYGYDAEAAVTTTAGQQWPTGGESWRESVAKSRS
jgi:salicylate hydroxylase